MTYVVHTVYIFSYIPTVVLEAVMLERWPYLVMAFALEQVFDVLFVRRLRARAASYCSEHFCTAVVVAYGDHRRHQAQLRIVRQRCQFMTLLAPPLGALREAGGLRATEVSHEGVRVMRTRAIGATHLSAPTVQVEELMRDASVEGPETVERRASEEALYLSETRAFN